MVQLKARIAGSAVDIPAPHIYEAVAPRYPLDKRGYVIDLTAYGDEDREGYYKIATQEIQNRIARIYDPGMDVERTRHISLFALAPIPLAMSALPQKRKSSRLFNDPVGSYEHLVWNREPERSWRLF